MVVISLTKKLSQIHPYRTGDLIPNMSNSSSDFFLWLTRVEVAGVDPAWGRLVNRILVRRGETGAEG